MTDNGAITDIGMRRRITYYDCNVCLRNSFTSFPPRWLVDSWDCCCWKPSPVLRYFVTGLHNIFPVERYNTVLAQHSTALHTGTWVCPARIPLLCLLSSLQRHCQAVQDGLSVCLSGLAGICRGRMGHVGAEWRLSGGLVFIFKNNFMVKTKTVWTVGLGPQVQVLGAGLLSTVFFSWGKVPGLVYWKPLLMAAETGNPHQVHCCCLTQQRGSRLAAN